MSEQLSPALTGTCAHLAGGATIRELAQLSCVCFFLFASVHFFS